MPTCPNGHQSVSDDWCEVCGHRMAGAGAPTGAVPPPPPPPPAYGHPGPGTPEGPAGYGYPGPDGPGAPGGYGYPAPERPGAPGGYGYPGPGGHGGPPPPPGGFRPGDGPGPGGPGHGGFGPGDGSGHGPGHGGFGPGDGPGHGGFGPGEGSDRGGPPPAPGGFGPGGPGPGGFGNGPGPGGHGPGPGGFGPGGDSNATAQAELCPQCRTPREHMAPFCEECRWNFLTHTATSYTPLAPQNAQRGTAAPQPPAPHAPAPPQPGPPPGPNLPPGFQSSPPPQGRQEDPFGYHGSRPSQVNRPAEPLGAEPTHHQAPSRRPPAQQQPGAPGQQPPAYLQGPAAPPGAPLQSPPQPRGDDDWVLSPPSHSEPPQRHEPPQPPPHQGPPQPPAHQGPPQQQFQPPRQPGTWTAYIGPDRDYFLAMMQRSGPEATGLNLPAYSPAKQLPLQGNQISVGRRRHSTGESPDIDLSVPPEDPGVSHQHAVLVQQPDGSWAVVDQNSTNGTTVNGGEEPIQPYVPVQLQDGDRVHVGAWTTITVRLG
ncbi:MULTISPECIES: FHA domain-containing protein [unclassified Streptomyces]|uniref:FHA domain-containing protein n=1 Tax=unclassified Streptomyces TaxID=2593676 RepID=UPI0038175176